MSDKDLTPSEALAILNAPKVKIPWILDETTALRRKVFGDKAILCSILNAKSGACPEDCTFCAQSARHQTNIQTYPLISADRISEAYDQASRLPITHFGIVTSGSRVTDREVDQVCEAVRKRPSPGPRWCSSLGMLDEGSLRRLRESGLTRYHHNLETAESFFPQICTTHTYAERVETVRAAQRAGLEVCSGSIFGLGETKEQRVEMAFALRDLGVQSIPMNFLVPIRGTRTENLSPLPSLDILKTIAMFRKVCPRAEIKVCAGREAHLGRSEQLIFAAGATGMMIGGYLTVQGRPVAEDLELIKSAGMIL